MTRLIALIPDTDANVMSEKRRIRRLGKLCQTVCLDLSIEQRSSVDKKLRLGQFFLDLLDARTGLSGRPLTASQIQGKFQVELQNFFRPHLVEAVQKHPTLTTGLNSRRKPEALVECHARYVTICSRLFYCLKSVQWTLFTSFTRSRPYGDFPMLD